MSLLCPHNGSMVDYHSNAFPFRQRWVLIHLFCSRDNLTVYTHWKQHNEQKYKNEENSSLHIGDFFCNIAQKY